MLRIKTGITQFLLINFVLFLSCYGRVMEFSSKIYVAGHTGLVGTSLVDNLRAAGYNNLVLRTSQELDLRNQQAVFEFFEKERPEYVFLAAAKVGGILSNNTYKAEFIYDNLMIASNVIHAAYKFGVKKLLNLGSSCIYPKFAPQPLKEEYLLTGTLEATNEPYAVAKISAIKLCRYYNEQYGTNFISVMPTNLYGQRDNFNLETAHVFPALFRKCYLAKLLRAGDFEGIKQDLLRYFLGYGLDGKFEFTQTGIREILAKIGVTESTITVWGSGKPLRELLYADELASACIFLMQNYNAADIGECINIGSGQEISIKDMALKIKEYVGFDGTIVFDASKPDGTPRKILDVSRLNMLGWHSKVTIDEGIKRTYAWYLEQSKKNRAIYQEINGVRNVAL